MTDIDPDQRLCASCNRRPARELAPTCSQACNRVMRHKARAAGEPPIKLTPEHMAELGRRGHFGKGRKKGEQWPT